MHTADLRHYEVESIHRVAVTTPVRTLIDLHHSESVPQHHLVEAVQQGIERGLIIQSDLKNSCWTREEQTVLQELAEQSKSYLAEA
jgi:uncharacterized ubiquitin-like protein YukD